MILLFSLFLVFNGQTPSGTTSVEAGNGKKDAPAKAPTETPAAAPTPGGHTAPAVPTGTTAAHSGGTGTCRLTGSTLEVVRGEKVVGTFAFPARPVKWRCAGERALAALGTRGLYVVSLANPARPRLLKVLDKGKNIVDFRVKGDLVLATSADFQVETYRLKDSGEVVPFVDVMSDPDAQKALFRSKRRRQRVGSVIRVTKGWATIRLEPGVALAAGDRVEIRSMRKVEHFSPLEDTVVLKATKNVVCVATVAKLKGNLVAISLGRGDAPEVGDHAFLTTRSITGSLWLPERQRDIWRAGLELYPLFSSSTDSTSALFFSAILRATLDYHGIRPYHIQVGIDPLQFVGTSQFDFGERIGANMFAMASYEEKQFEIGLGVGYQLPLLHGLSEHNRQGVVLVQMLRLGARDGINLMAKFQSVYSDDNREKTTRAMVGVFLGEINVPVSKSVNIFTRYMGDGRTLNNVSLGLKTFLWGNGGPGTLIIPVSIGYTRFSPYYKDSTGLEDSTEQLEVYGVTFSIGMEQRF